MVLGDNLCCLTFFVRDLVQKTPNSLLSLQKNDEVYHYFIFLLFDCDT